MIDSLLLSLSLSRKKAIHFVGIGGIGMSGIAEVMFNLGYSVQGSDKSSNAQTQRLESIGVKVFSGHCEQNVTNAFVVIVSSAVSRDNIEVEQARLLGIPVIQRAQMLSELMRLKHSIAISGTHGKTTTTSLIAQLLETANFDPTVVNGGIINSYKSNAKKGTGDWIVVEADESDGSFTNLFPTICVVTNIDMEHVDHYASYEDLVSAYNQFIHNLPFYGTAILCIDHPMVYELAKIIKDRRVITYGFHEEAMVRAINIRPELDGVVFDVHINYEEHRFIGQSENIVPFSKHLSNLKLPMLGMHNVQNTLSLVAVAQELHITDVMIKDALSAFEGVKRRFTVVGKTNGITVIDDYAHHPAEIQTVIASAKQACPEGRVFAVIQPHRYSRLKYLMDEFSQCFNGSDHIFVCPVYAAGEKSMEGVDHEVLCQKIKLNYALPVNTAFSVDDLCSKIQDQLQSGDIVLMMGAGDITHWATQLFHKLETSLEMTQQKSTAI